MESGNGTHSTTQSDIRCKTSSEIHTTYPTHIEKSRSSNALQVSVNLVLLVRWAADVPRYCSQCPTLLHYCFRNLSLKKGAFRYLPQPTTMLYLHLRTCDQPPLIMPPLTYSRGTVCALCILLVGINNGNASSSTAWNMS